MYTCMYCLFLHYGDKQPIKTTYLKQTKMCFVSTSILIIMNISQWLADEAYTLTIANISLAVHNRYETFRIKQTILLCLLHHIIIVLIHLVCLQLSRTDN